MESSNKNIRTLIDMVRIGLAVVVAVILAGCVQGTSVVGGEAGWMSPEETRVMNDQSRRFKMLGRGNIRLRTIGDGESALVFKVVVDDLMQRNQMTVRQLDLSKYHVLYGDRGDETMLFFNIRADSHDRILLKDSNGVFIQQLTNYPYIEYWVDRRTWQVLAGVGHPF